MKNFILKIYLVFASALFIQEEAKAQQFFTFYSDDSFLPIPDDAYNGTFSSMAYKELTVSGIPAGMHYVDSKSKITVYHTWAGDLVFKLFDDIGFAMGLMSRPGVEELGDIGDSTAGPGANIDLGGTLIFHDYASVSSEDIAVLGNPVPDNSEVRPSKGAIESSWDTFFDFFGGMTPAQINNTTWYYAIGDAAADDTGHFAWARLELIYDHYCVPRIGSYNVYMSNVTFSDINNTTEDEIVKYPAYYTTAMEYPSANISRGQAYPLSVTFDYTTKMIESYYIYAFFDWNQDGDFDDEGEMFTVVENTVDLIPHTVDITIPESAELGETRMRILLGTNIDTPNPCDEELRGEVEDYTVVVQEAMGIHENSLQKFAVYPNPVKNVLNISSQKAVEKAEIYTTAGQLVLTETHTTQINVSALPAGIYVAKITSDGDVETFKVIKN